MDKRDLAALAASDNDVEYDHDAAAITFWWRDDDDIEHSITLRSKYEVCPTCRGRGRYVNPSIDAHGITEEERARDWSAEDWEGYMTGAYDIECVTCRGRNVVLVPHDDNDATDLARWKSHVRTRKEDLREQANAIRMGY